MSSDQLYHHSRAEAEQAMAAASTTGTGRLCHLKLARLHRALAEEASAVGDIAIERTSLRVTTH